jgi:hypothetical protein
MDKYYLVIAGTGETSRANVEALIEDYIYGHGQDVTFVLPYEKRPSQGQIFAAQLAKDKSKDILLFCKEDANYEGLPSSSVSHSDRPLETACAKLKDTNIVAFVLVDDEDPSINETLSVFSEYKVPAFDLTEGLMPIKFNPGAVEVKTEVAIPEAEEMPEPEEEDEDDLDDFEDLDDLEDEELAEDFYLGVQALAKMIAREVAAELLKATETPKKGSRK